MLAGAGGFMPFSALVVLALPTSLPFLPSSCIFQSLEKLGKKGHGNSDIIISKWLVFFVRCPTDVVAYSLTLICPKPYFTKPGQNSNPDNPHGGLTFNYFAIFVL